MTANRKGNVMSVKGAAKPCKRERKFLLESEIFSLDTQKQIQTSKWQTSQRSTTTVAFSHLVAQEKKQMNIYIHIHMYTHI